MQIGIDAHLFSLTASYRQAGVSRYIAELIRRLAVEPAAHRYTVFTPPGGVGDLLPPATERGQRPALPHLRVVASRLPTQRPPVRIAWEQFIAPPAALAHRLHLFHGPVNVVPLAMPCPTVVTIHDLAFLVYPERFRLTRRVYLTALTRLSVRRAARVIAVSEHTARDIVTRLGVPAERVVVVPNAAADEFRPEPDPAVLDAFRASKGLPPRFLLFIGTLEPRKNVTGLLRAFARIADEFPDVPLVIGGGRGWLDGEIFATHAGLGLGDRVRFVGYLPAAELPRWYQSATIFAYPSLYEGFGLPVLEAMACGTAVITSTVSSLPEVAGTAGLTVDPHDDAALAAALRQLLAEPDRRASLRAAGLARAATFSWSRMARETQAVYASLDSTA